ncbi:MAG: GNAT family N-acetyltransferase [Salinicola sp.]|uniref:GNAT family N-acetyltransferase n=1 Tax=Salinicola sp. TaxID=1978524 RepID=UPI001D910253|nr:GNAT family N-acetyltransferase [Salinicola sp.]NRB55472.1 GNAT family N-acetyltransferase [Salinicola sp.]
MSAIRLARATDRQAVEALVTAAYGHYVERIGKTPGPIRDIGDNRYARHIAAGHVNLLVEGDEVVGLLVLIPKPDTLLLDNVAVAPAAQGRGFGRKLMALAETRARQLGFDNVTLYTQELMHENLAIYRRYGYVETHRAEEAGLRRIYLRKPLS